MAGDTNGKSSPNIKEIENRIFDQKIQPKYIRDPVHDIIKIEDRVILQILDSHPMQRLRRIAQLPFASLVYPGADHSRFAHSLGVYHVAGLMLDPLNVTDEYDKFIIRLAALLHDVGHGPFSHLFEDILRRSGYTGGESPSVCTHEWWSRKIICEHEEIVKTLESIDKNLPTEISNIIQNTSTKRKLSCIVSSQFDADRLDYMLRDSLMTGVQYGKYDLNWLMRNLSCEPVKRVGEDRLPEGKDIEEIVIDGKRGLSTLEDYFIGLFYLYQHVYFHHTVLSAEGMLLSIMLRAIDLIRNKENIGVDNVQLRKIAHNEMLSLQEYLGLNDSLIYSWVGYWAENDVDKILHRLSTDLVNRRLFKAIDITDKKGAIGRRIVDKIKNLLKKNELDQNYFMIERGPERAAYKNLLPYWATNKPVQEIYYKNKDGGMCPYSGAGIPPENNVISGAILMLKMKADYIIVPYEIKGGVDKIMEECDE